MIEDQYSGNVYEPIASTNIYEATAFLVSAARCASSTVTMNFNGIVLTAWAWTKADDLVSAYSRELSRRCATQVKAAARAQIRKQEPTPNQLRALAAFARDGHFGNYSPTSVGGLFGDYARSAVVASLVRRGWFDRKNCRLTDEGLRLVAAARD